MMSIDAPINPLDVSHIEAFRQLLKKKVSEYYGNDMSEKYWKTFVSNVKGNDLNILNQFQRAKETAKELELDKHCIEEAYHLIKSKTESKLNNPSEFIESTTEHLPTISLSDMLEKGIPHREWYIQNLLTKDGITILGGEAGCYKTWIGMHMAVCLASGENVLGKFQTEKTRILYVDEENGDVTLPERFALILKGLGLQQNVFHGLNLSIFNNVKLDIPDGVLQLKSLIDRTQPKVIIIDSMVRCMEGEENDASHVRDVFDNIKILFNEYKNLSFILLHHTTKDGRKGMSALRGSGDFSAMADVVLMFNSKHRGYVTVTVAKNRHIDLQKLPAFCFKVEELTTEKGETIGIRFEHSESNNPQDAIQKCKRDIIEWLEDSEKQVFLTSQALDYASNLGNSRDSFYKALNSLQDEGMINKLGRGKFEVEMNHHIVDYEDV